MKEMTTRAGSSGEDLAREPVREEAGRAESAADQVDRAKARSPSGEKLRFSGEEKAGGDGRAGSMDGGESLRKSRFYSKKLRSSTRSWEESSGGNSGSREASYKGAFESENADAPYEGTSAHGEGNSFYDGVLGHESGGPEKAIREEGAQTSRDAAKARSAKNFSSRIREEKGAEGVKNAAGTGKSAGYAEGKKPGESTGGSGVPPGNAANPGAGAGAEKTFSSKLWMKATSAEGGAAKLRFGNAKVSSAEIRPPRRRMQVVREAGSEISGRIRASAAENADDNVGVEAMNETEGAAETTLRTIDSRMYSRKLRQYKKTARLEAKADRANMDALTENAPEGASSNPISRWRQRQAIKKEYAAARAGKSAGSAVTAGRQLAGNADTARQTGNIISRTREFGNKVFGVLKEHPQILVGGGVIAILVLIMTSIFSLSSAMLSGSGNTVLVTSFTAEDDDILGAEQDYRAMEASLREEIRRIREENPEYDEVEITGAEINHDPYELAAFLTVLYEDYTREEVQLVLREIFEAQYQYSTSHRTETVTETKEVRVGESLGEVVKSGYCNCPICCGIWSGGPTASGVYPTSNHTIAVDAQNPFVPMGTKVVMNGVEYTVEDTGNFDRYGVQFDVYYDSHMQASLHGHKTWEAFIADDNGSQTVEVTKTETKKILTVEVRNRSLAAVIASWGLTDEEMERYRILVTLKGNKSYLFKDDIYANATEVLHYDIPGEALSDVRFARMIQEAEKYLGYPYVWGGESPETSFDCSGFVSWVINHCENGWNYGRLTAEGLRQVCAIIPPSEAKPGDLVFFQGTYDTSGASHVAIYVGNGMMIHCGHPVQYASMQTSYWQAHFYCFGRLP